MLIFSIVIAFFLFFSASCLPSGLSDLLVFCYMSLCPFLSVQAMFGISSSLQEPAGSLFASEPASVWRPAFLWPSQPGEDSAGHGQPDCPAWLELPLPWPGAQLPLLQVSQWAIRGVCFFSESMCLYVARVFSFVSAQYCAYVHVLHGHMQASYPLIRDKTAYKNQ